MISRLILRSNKVMSGLVLGCLLGLAPVTHVWAGAQQEEDLADAVKNALSRLIADPRPPQLSWTDSRQQQTYERWFDAMSERLRRKVPDQITRKDLLNTVWYEAKRAGLDPAMVLGLMQVESNFRKYAISHAGARGYMQVMPFWTKVIGDSDPNKLFHMQANLRYGCTILRYYLDKERGNLFMTLGRYNGSRGRSEYPNLVLAAWQNWKFDGAELAALPTVKQKETLKTTTTIDKTKVGVLDISDTPTKLNPFSKQRL